MVDITLTAYGNICFSPEHVTNKAMERLVTDLRKNLSGDIEVDTLVRIWDRLAKTGAYGQGYVSRHRSLLMQWIEAGAVTAR